MKKQTQEDFISKANKKHNNKFDYSKVDYVNSTTKVIIICPEHGEFNQPPASHVYGIGCPYCKAINIKKALQNDVSDFITKAKEVHGNRYDYSKVVYNGNKSKVTIICPEHGEFKQIPNNHMRKSGCNKCRGDKLAREQTLTKDQFVERARVLHGDKYDYSKVVYTKSKSDVIIICPKHGEFEQRPNYHLSNNGCPTCKASKGEVALYNIFKKHNINFIAQYCIPDVQPRLRYDFYLPDRNLLIEFQGIQHYQAIDHFGGEEGFKDNQRRDVIKKAIAREMRIPLVEFNYRQLQLEELEFERIVLNRILSSGKV